MLSLRIPPPIWTLLGGATMWLLHRFLPVLDLWRTPWTGLGWCLMAAAVLPMLAALNRFQRAGTTVDPRDPRKATALVTGGVYRRIRHPSEAGLLVAALSAGVLLRSAAALALWALVVLPLAVLRARREDRLLAGVHGEAHAAWRRRAGMLGPRIRRGGRR
jgi:protein-S-isoprenylcysteine O-methyltransferase Ste14